MKGVGRRQLSLRSSADYDSDCFNTPEEVVEAIGYVDTDPCSNEWSHVRSAMSYSLDEGENGLTSPWHGLVYTNPPFSDTLPWIKRGVRHVRDVTGGGYIALLKLDPTTAVYRALYEAHATIYSFRRRLHFTYHTTHDYVASFPCMIAYLGVEASPAMKALCYPAFEKPARKVVGEREARGPKRLLKSR